MSRGLGMCIRDSEGSDKQDVIVLHSRSNLNRFKEVVNLDA